MERAKDRLRGSAVHAEFAWPAIVNRLGDRAPVFPGPNVIACPVVPPPPLITTDDAEERAFLVARALYGALGTRFGTRAPPYAPGREMRRARGFVDFCDAADALEARGIAPGAWMAFSADAWREYDAGGSGKPRSPPVKWMTSPRRLLEREEWFRAVENRYCGGQLRVPPAVTAAVSAYRRMQHAVLAELGDRDVEAVPVDSLAALVERALPAHQYAALLAAARTAATSETEMLAKLMAKGVFLW